MRIVSLILASAALANAWTAGAETVRQPAQRYAITLQRETERQSDDGSSGSSHDRWGWTERVLAKSDAGVELEYDLPTDATADDRAREWKLPARVLRPTDGPLQLLNRPELETRLASWLQRANWTREICGKWIFTWNAFHIDCDPLTVLPVLENLDMRPDDLRVGALYRDAKAREVVPLKLAAPSQLVADLVVDPEAVRRSRAQSDVVVGEIMKQPVTLEAAIAKHASEAISGTMRVVLEVDAAGLLKRRTETMELTLAAPNGKTENQTSTEILERKLLD